MDKIHQEPHQFCNKGLRRPTNRCVAVSESGAKPTRVQGLVKKGDEAATTKRRFKAQGTYFKGRRFKTLRPGALRHGALRQGGLYAS
jgi:hypothetical protein